jgi:predicted metal-dependent phosphoesterase TrpH
MAGTPRCDLHSHTFHSDGALAPEALVDLAVDSGLAALAVTDHDTVDGVAAAVQRGAERGLEVVAGIELSVEEDGRDVHLLGYFVSRSDVLREALETLREERRVRARRTIEILASLGVQVEYERVAARAQGGVVGRPHVAEEMVACGHATSIDDAFDRFLGGGRPAHVAKRALGLAEAARLLRRAGAVPVVAHPGASHLGALLPRLRPAGVMGLEVWHPKHDPRQTRRYLEACRRHGLLPTGGTDFHRLCAGGLRPGDIQVPLHILDALRPHAT